MSEERLSGWFGPLAWAFTVIGVCTLAYFVAIDDGDRCPQGRMPWSCISWNTIDRYERQMGEDLPIGTPRQQVEDYLHREGVAFSDQAAVPPGPPQLRIDKSWKGLMDVAELDITIVFGADGGVAEIRFHKFILAP